MSDLTVRPNTEKYAKGRTKEGFRFIDNGDDIAEKLRGLHIQEVYSVVASALGVKAKELKAKYEHLNIGMQRMALGNLMRGHLKKNA